MFCLHLRNPFQRKRKERKTDFDFPSVDKYISNHAVEGRITTFSCYTRKCRYNLSPYRCVRLSSNNDVKYEEAIRIEQSIEKGTGKVVEEVKLTFGEEFRKIKAEFAAAEKLDVKLDEKLDEKSSFQASEYEHYDHFKKKYYVVVKEERLTTVVCVGCGCKTEFWNMVRKYDGERLRWFFGRKCASWPPAEDLQKGEKPGF